MENRYQQFLKEKLGAGLVELQANPSATEVAGIPIEAFDVLVRAFRSGLTHELEITLPHNLKDPAYLDALLSKINTLLLPRIPESVTSSSVTTIKGLVVAYENAQELKSKLVASRAGWQKIYEEQVARYNQDLITRLEDKLRESLPKEADNPDIIKPLARDIAQTLEDQELPSVKYSYQTRGAVQRAAEKVLKTYGSAASEIQADPQAATKIAQAVAEQEAAIQEESLQEGKFSPETFGEKKIISVWDKRAAQISATTTPTTNEVGSAIETSVTVYLKTYFHEVYEENSAIASKISEQLLGRLSRNFAIDPENTAQLLSPERFQKQFSSEIRAAIAKNLPPKILEERQESIEKAAAQIAEGTSPLAYDFTTSPSSGAEMIGGIVGPAAVAGPTGPTPSAPTPSDYAPKGSLLELFQSSGAPLHSLAAMASPRSGLSLAKWTATGGFIRAPFWFVWESIPGMPKPDYLEISLLGLDRIKSDLDEALNGKPARGKKPPEPGIKARLASATDELEKYKLEREKREVEQRLKIVNPVFDLIHNNPTLEKIYNAYFGPVRFALHPFQSFNTWLINKNILAGLGTSGLTDVFFAYLYGGPGGAYASEEWLKMYAVFALKVLGQKIGLYEVVGEGLRKKYVFKPTHRLKLKIQKAIASRLAKSGVGKAVKAAATKVATWIATQLAKLGITASGLVSAGVGTVIGILLFLWPLIKKVLKYLGYALLGLIIWLFATFPPWIVLSSLLTGIGTFFMLGPFGLPVAVIGAFTSAIGSAFLYKWASDLGFSVSSTISTALGNLSSSLGAILGKISLSSLAAPISIISLTSVTVPTLYFFFNLSSGFWIPLPQSPLQSAYIKVTKTAQFSGNIGDPINYTLVVEALLKPLTNVKITDTTTFSCQGQPPTVPVRTFTAAQISPGTPLVLHYQVSTNSQFNNCLVTNTAVVMADIPDAGKTGEQSFAIFNLTIGSPPFDLPSGWPVDHGCITQGPNVPLDTHRGVEAIDIAVPVGTPVYATHNGTVTLVRYGNPTFGNYVIITGVGPNGAFSTLYAHLSRINVVEEQKVKRGDLIGLSGDTGNVTGPHLHYEFRGLIMGPPYIPIAVPACDSKEECNICW